MEVFPHITQRLEKRICVQFDERPGDLLLYVLKCHGNHRPIGKGQRAWQFSSDSWAMLFNDLRGHGYSEVAESVAGIMRRWHVSDQEQEQVESSGESHESD